MTLPGVPTAGSTLCPANSLSLVLLVHGEDRANGMDDVACWKPMAARHFRLPDLAAAQLAAFLKETWPCGYLNGPVHAAATEQGFVRGVHDRVNVQFGDVALTDLHSALVALHGLDSVL